MTGLADGDEFVRAIRGCRRLVFRLETLQVYRGSGEDEWIAAFERGAPHPPPEPEQDEWEAMIRSMTAAGVLIQRVHVVTEPLTDYLRFELAWAYPPNAAAGEDVSIADATAGWPMGVARHDYWLLDDRVYDGVYEPDGTWRGVRPQHGQAAIEAAQKSRLAALGAAVPLADFLATHPDVAERVATG